MKGILTKTKFVRLHYYLLFSLDKKTKDLEEKDKIIAELRAEVAKVTVEIGSLKAQLEASASGFGATQRILDQQLQVTHC